jgi:hypothetical protein
LPICARYRRSSDGVWRKTRQSRLQDGHRRANSEAWRPLRLTFPDTIATHSKVQTIYAGEDGLLRRHDYAVEIAADSSAAHYLDKYVTVDGIKFPTERRVYAAGADGKPIRDIMTVSATIASYKRP